MLCKIMQWNSHNNPVTRSGCTLWIHQWKQAQLYWDKRGNVHWFPERTTKNEFEMTMQFTEEKRQKLWNTAEILSCPFVERDRIRSFHAWLNSHMSSKVPKLCTCQNNRLVYTTLDYVKIIYFTDFHVIFCDLRLSVCIRNGITQGSFDKLIW